MSDILREVDDAMRVEKMVKIWHEHKTALLVACAAFVLGTAASSAYSSWTMHQKKETTTAIVTAMDGQKPLEALTAAAEADHSNFKSLALMSAAAQAMNAKKIDTAVNLYTQVISDRSAPPLFRDLAIVQKVSINMDQGKDAKAEDLLKDINAVANNDDSPWVGQALFTRALVKAHKAKDIKGAIGDLELVTQKTELPNSLRQRAQALIDTYQLKDQS